MKRSFKLSSLLLVFLAMLGHAQTQEKDSLAMHAVADAVKTLNLEMLGDSTKVTKDSVVPLWTYVNKATLDINEVAFVNWNAGGTNSISGLLGVEFQRNYHKDHMLWENKAFARYGVNKQQEQDLRKTDDILEVHSRFGYRKDTISNWYTSANFSFKTQFTNGYNYTNSDREAISKFMAPAYMFLGVGTAYGEHIKSFSAYLSPLTLKSTFVLDEDLADAGSFGVTPARYDDLGNKISDGKTSRHEVGVLVTSSFEKEVIKNISVRNLVSLYTDYINDFGNVDVDWELHFNFQVNEYVRASMGSHLKYDNDIKIMEEDEGSDEATLEGAKVQWKQLLGIGVSVDF